MGSAEVRGVQRSSAACPFAIFPVPFRPIRAMPSLPAPAQHSGDYEPRARKAKKLVREPKPPARA